MDEMDRQPKMGLKTKLGYGIGQLGDSLGYNVFYYFFMFFLTDLAGIPPAVAGSVSLIAVLWDGITDPIVGYISDNMRNRFGRRRPLMLGAAIPYGISMFLLFHDVPLSQGAKGIYFILVSMLFWTFYTIYVIPYFALGGEMTENFEERTSVRTWASVFMYLAVFIASATPPMIVKFAENKGATTIEGWGYVGLSFSFIILAIILLCWFCTKGRERPVPNTAKEKPGDIFKSYFSLLKLKPLKFLAGSVFLWSLVCSISSSGPVYMMTSNLNLPAEQQSLFFTISSCLAIFWIPVISFLTKKFDKKLVYCYAMLLSGVVMVLFAFIGIKNLTYAVVSCFFFTFGNTTFWTLYFSLMYDLNEVDEFVNGKRREGAITALLGLFQKFGAAAALQIMGLILQFGGYGVAGKEDMAYKTILYVNTLVPGIIGILAAVCVMAYPLTKQKHSRLLQVLRLKKSGDTYTTEGIEDIL